MAKKKATKTKVTRSTEGKTLQPCRRCGCPPAKAGYSPARIRLSDWICNPCISKRAALRRGGKVDPFVKATGEKATTKKAATKKSTPKPKSTTKSKAKAKPTAASVDPEVMESTADEPQEMLSA